MISQHEAVVSLAVGLFLLGLATAVLLFRHESRRVDEILGPDDAEDLYRRR